ncbi:unnamed protein product [Cuscuta epithymum]|uniref:Response regulatory domain-containing protein n=1 Tax=Cuscuta epithymum TaxID=186058 RepID=A0AAV0FXJ3_9ASTE|nr:unnamed protein product [Cuscuta epithymum]CAH9145420.1 unnamed protein product [Cuscuta epithymum]
MGKGKSTMLSSNNIGNTSECRNAITDCSRVRILLCDFNAESCGQVLQLLTQCSYQVAPVTSTAQMFDALESEDPCMDIILTEIAILIANGSSIMSSIKQNVSLRHTSVIMMVTNEEVSLIGKGLGYGAADYLVKPLSIHEIKNLRIHIK